MGQSLIDLLNGHGLSRESGFVDMKVAGGNQAHIGRNLVAGLQQDDVAGHHLSRRNPSLLSCTEYRGLSDHGLGKGLHSLDGLGLLKKADHGINKHHPEDDAGVDPFL